MGRTSLAVKGAILLAAIFAFLKVGVPLFTAPLPMSLVWLYVFLTACGIGVYGTLTGESIESLFGPVFQFLVGGGLVGTARSLRLSVLVLFHLFVGCTPCVVLSYISCTHCELSYI